MARRRGLRGRFVAGCDHRVDDAGHWLLTADERGNPASGLPAWTSGNQAGALVDGATYFDPHDRDGLAKTMKMYCDNDLARDDLAARGHTHVVQRQQRICPTAAADEICAELVARRL